MANILQNEYHPDFVSSPGETLLETLEALGMSQAKLAKRMGRPVKTINEIIRKNAIITPETALQLEQVLHVPASFWLKREYQYREFLARRDEEQHFANWVKWLNELPMREMVRRGWIPPCTNEPQQVAEALKFFSVASPDAWKDVWASKVIVYHKPTTLKSNFGSVTAWLRRGEIEAQKIETLPYNADAFLDALKHIRKLTVEPFSFLREELVHLCANAGVAVVFVQELPNTGICGATQWLASEKALVQLSLRYKTDDHLWFTFFHEAGHILSHGKRQFFLEIEHKEQKTAEDEADTFATNILIDPTHWHKFIRYNSYQSKADIQQFAAEIGIAPGIVVGRLQHEKLLPFDHCNDLKCHLEWDIK